LLLLLLLLAVALLLLLLLLLLALLLELLPDLRTSSRCHPLGRTLQSTRLRSIVTLGFICMLAEVNN